MSDISMEMALSVHQIREGIRVLRLQYLKQGCLKDEVQGLILRILFDHDYSPELFYSNLKDEQHDLDEYTTQMIMLICTQYEQCGLNSFEEFLNLILYRIDRRLSMQSSSSSSPSNQFQISYQVNDRILKEEQKLKKLNYVKKKILKPIKYGTQSKNRQRKIIRSKSQEQLKQDQNSHTKQNQG